MNTLSRLNQAIALLCLVLVGATFAPISASDWQLATPPPVGSQYDSDQVPPQPEPRIRSLEHAEEEVQFLRAKLAGLSNDQDRPASTNPMPPPGDMDAILKRLDALEKKLASGKSGDSKTTDKKTDDPKKPTDKDGKGSGSEKKDDDSWTDVSTEKWTVKLGGHMQADTIHWANANAPVPAQDYFEFRRLRLLADGTGYGVYDFRIQIDIEPEAGDGVTTPVTDIKDAYFSINDTPLFDRIRIGNFFVPFSLEQVTNDTNNIFMERSIPTQGIFAADREVGMAFYGVNDAQNVTWTTGVFFDSISESLKERIDDNQGARVSGRLTWLPYYDELSNGRYLLHLGTGILYTDDQDKTLRYRARPQIHEGPFLIDSGNIAANSSTAANVEMATVWGSFSAQSELFACTVDQVTGGTRDLYGAYVYLSYFLTGENRIYERFGQHGAQFARNVPITNFFWVPGGFGSGAWEAKARFSYLDLNQLNKGEYNDFTAGFNWYWSDRVRMMFDWIHPMTTAPTSFGAQYADLIAMRFDFNF